MLVSSLSRVHWIHLHRLISTLFTLAHKQSIFSQKNCTIIIYALCIQSRHRDAIMLIEIHFVVYLLVESGHSFTLLVGPTMLDDQKCIVKIFAILILQKAVRSVITFWSVCFDAIFCNTNTDFEPLNICILSYLWISYLLFF